MSLTNQRHDLGFTINGRMIKQSVKSFVLSKKYCRILLKASIFNIICRRLPVNKDDLESREYNGASFYVVKDMKTRKDRDPYIETFLYWLKGIRDGIDKNYLKYVYILLKNADDALIESYSFTLKYNTDPNFSNKNENGRTSDEVKNATTAILSVIAELGKVPQLDPETTLQIEFMYNDDCPMDYEPPGFVASTHPLCLKVKTSTILGKLNTGFHKIVARSSQFPMITASKEDLHAKPDQEIPQDDLNKSLEKDDLVELISVSDGSVSIAPETEAEDPYAMDTEISQNYSDIDEEELISRLEKTRKKCNNSNVTISDQDITTPDVFTEDVDMETAEKVDCVCKLNLPKNIPLLKCLLCGKSYHKPCFGPNDEDFDMEFTCPNCKSPQNKEMCKFKFYFHRLLLTFTLALESGELPVEIINCMSAEDQQNIIEDMIKSEIYIPDPEDPKKGRVNTDVLEQYLKQMTVDDSQYFN